MIEVFKTNVDEPAQANALIDKIHSAFPGYEINFDLEDCDRIMRVKCYGVIIQTEVIVQFFKEAGFIADVLVDDFELSSHFRIFPDK